MSAVYKFSVIFGLSVFLLLYNRYYLEFLYARTRYNWVMSYSNGTVIEVNVIQSYYEHDEEVCLLYTSDAADE